MAAVVGIYVAPVFGGATVAYQYVELQENGGIIGDRYQDKNVSFITLNEVHRANRCINSAVFKFSPSETRRNIVIDGIPDLTALIGKEFRVGLGIFRGLGPISTCTKPSKYAHKWGFKSMFADPCGIRAISLARTAILNDDRVVV